MSADDAGARSAPTPPLASVSCGQPQLSSVIEALPETVRNLRHERGKSLKVAAEEMGVGLWDLSRFETRKTGPRGFTTDRLLRVVRWVEAS